MAYPERRSGKLTGRWCAQTRHKKHTFKATLPSKAEADAFETWVKANGTEPPWIASGAAGAGPTFAACAKLCKDAGGPNGYWRVGRDPSVVQRLEYVVAFLGEMPISTVDTQVLERLVADLRRRPGLGTGKNKKLSPSTINRYLDAASAVLTYACDSLRAIPTAPKVPKQVARAKPRTTISEPQEAAVRAWLIEHGHSATEICIRFLVATGFRRGELAGLRPEQIEHDRVVLDTDQTKTDEARTVYIDVDMASEMRALVARGEVPVAWQLLRVFKRACEACGLSVGIVLHSLRHTTATRLLRAGVDMRVVQRFLGHKSIVTTQLYTHVEDDMLREAAKKLSPRCGLSEQMGSVVALAPKAKAR